MRTVVLLDTKIDKDEALALLDEYSDFIKKHTDIDCTWWVERHDFSSVPTVPDEDGDLKPTREYRKELQSNVHNRYGDYGTDNILWWVHEDNFLFKGIWGTNWSYNFYPYSLHLCRWDKDNPANTFGTLYHEQMHSFDMVIRKELGIEINEEFIDWDSRVVHGNGPWDYIRYQENTKALEVIASRLKQAYDKRKETYLAPFKRVQKMIINILKRIISNHK